MIYHSHLNTAAQVVGAYPGGQPFALYLKEFFRADRKYGSRDRKQISHLCYCYFRLGRLAAEMPVHHRIMLGVFLCAGPGDVLPPAFDPAWIEAIGSPLKEKCRIAGITYEAARHFPAVAHVSAAIDLEPFTISHFHQPRLFIRVRPEGLSTVSAKLLDAGISYIAETDTLFAMANSTGADKLLELDKEAVIQDASSQRVASLLPEMKGKFSLWDCCAASGGKSIMAVDHYAASGNNGIQLTVSDVRESILHNLRQRFQRAGIYGYKSFVADLASARFNDQSRYDLIIADVPCSGSGTWGRTPEHLYFFPDEKISHYSGLQRKIIDSSVPSLAAGGYYLYITCSVYRDENENAVEYIAGKGLRLLRMEYFKGYNAKADTLFAAIFTSGVQHPVPGALQQ